MSLLPDTMKARQLASACGQRSLALGPAAPAGPKPSLLSRPRSPGFGPSRPTPLTPEPSDGR